MLCKHNKLICVCSRIGMSQYGIITGALGFEAQLSPCNPNQRMEPITRAHGTRKTSVQPISSPHVFQLMDNRPRDLSFGPGL
jgi:hypothetical protein